MTLSVITTESNNGPELDDAPVCFSRAEARGLAIRVEDAMRVMASLLDGAEANTSPTDYKRRTLIIMARDRNRHLEYVVARLRGESVATGGPK